MTKTFTYTILQYRHSLLLDEAVNIGILFEFSEDDVILFSEGDLNRLKSIYIDFDTPSINRVLKSIQNKSIEISKDSRSLFKAYNVDELYKHLLRDSDSSLQFSKPKIAYYPFDSIDKIVEEYNSLFLPLGSLSRISRKIHNDNYIFRTYTNLLFQNRRELEIVALRDTLVKTKDVSLTFDLAWQNGTLNLVKPLSFDYQDADYIQNRSVAYFGYLTKLRDYGENRKMRYDLLVTRPQNQELLTNYDKALKIIKSANSPMRVVTEEELNSYVEETAYSLRIEYNKMKEAL